MILLLLDLSAVFDAVKYDTVVGRLASRLGIHAVVLQWLNSYLRSRTQTVTIMDAMSVRAELLFGVRQRTVLGLPLFVLYVLPLSDVVRPHKVHTHG